MPGEDGSANAVVYAEGCDPQRDEDWYETSRTLFGDDDFAVAVPAEWFSLLLQHEPGARQFRIRLSADAIELVL